jgi:hypothetical protein
MAPICCGGFSAGGIAAILTLAFAGAQNTTSDAESHPTLFRLFTKSPFTNLPQFTRYSPDHLIIS